MQAVGPEETDAIRRHLRHQRIYAPDRFRLAIERQLGRKLGPKKIGWPKKPSSILTTCWKVDSDPCFPACDIMAGAPPKEIAVNMYERKIGSALAYEESGGYPGSFTLPTP